MIPYVCDDPDRVAARIYATIRLWADETARGDDPPPDCPCCAFWRGFLLALVLGIFVGAAAMKLIHP